MLFKYKYWIILKLSVKIKYKYERIIFVNNKTNKKYKKCNRKNRFFTELKKNVQEKLI